MICLFTLNLFPTKSFTEDETFNLYNATIPKTRNKADFKAALMASPKMGFSKKLANNGVNTLVHSQLSANNANTIAATGINFFDSGITPIFHLMKAKSKTKYTK